MTHRLKDSLHTEQNVSLTRGLDTVVGSFGGGGAADVGVDDKVWLFWD